MTSGIDLVVVSYHSPDHLVKFYEALLDCESDLSLSLVIVNVEATEDEKSAADQWGHKIYDAGIDCCVMNYPDNCGYAKACNDGARFGTAHDTVALFNADTELRPGVLESCHKLLWSAPDIAICGPRQVDLNGRITAAGVRGTLTNPVQVGWHEWDRGQYVEDETDIVSVVGSMFFVKRHVWNELAACPSYRAVDPHSTGAFLNTHLYYEESWCAWHSHSHNYRVAYSGSPSAIHRWHGAISLAGEGTHFKDSKCRFVEACETHQPPIPHD